MTVEQFADALVSAITARTGNHHDFPLTYMNLAKMVREIMATEPAKSFEPGYPKMMEKRHQYKGFEATWRGVDPPARKMVTNSEEEEKARLEGFHSV
jgi:hypothetical protein